MSDLQVGIVYATAISAIELSFITIQNGGKIQPDPNSYYSALYKQQVTQPLLNLPMIIR